MNQSHKKTNAQRVSPRGNGSRILNSDAVSATRGNQRTPYNPTFEQNMAKNAYIDVKFFDQKIDETNKVKVGLETVSEQNLNQINFENWFRKLTNLVKSNQWTPGQLNMVLQTITSEELHRYFTTRKSTEGILKGIRSALFPETRFPQLEQSLSKIRARYFKDLRNYYVEFLSRFR